MDAESRLFFRCLSFKIVRNYSGQPVRVVRKVLAETAFRPTLGGALSASALSTDC